MFNDLKSIIHTSPYIHESSESIFLSFSFNDVQSQMDKDDPIELALEYTQIMMGFLLFNPQARDIGMVGLGGGSLAKYCYHKMPFSDIDVIEINPFVIELRSFFRVPEDSERFRVICEDAANFFQNPYRQYDVLLLDGFDVCGMPEQLCSKNYYKNCYDSLKAHGIIVANMHRCDPMFEIYINRINSVFSGAVVLVEGMTSSNCIVFAFKDASMQLLSPSKLPSQADDNDLVSPELLPSMVSVFFASRSQGLKKAMKKMAVKNLERDE